jgi:putative ABC transport system permease protein
MVGGSLRSIKYGLRALAKNPSFSVPAIMALALGIGINAGVFSIVNGWLLRPLPVPHPEELVVLALHQGSNQLLTDFAYADFLDYRNQADGFSDLAGYNSNLGGISVDGKPQRVALSYVTGNLFSMLGVKPEVGQLINPTEGQTPGADPVVVLGYSFWKKEFNSDPTVVGRSLLLNGRPVTVIGVAAKDFHGVYSLAETEAYAPLSLAALDTTSMAGIWTQRDKRLLLRVIGRLKPGVTLNRARASLNAVAARLAMQYPDTNRDIKVHIYPEWQARSEPNAADSVPVIATLFLVLAAFVLIVACANVFNILLVRAIAKERVGGARRAGRLPRPDYTVAALRDHDAGGDCRSAGNCRWAVDQPRAQCCSLAH